MIRMYDKGSLELGRWAAAAPQPASRGACCFLGLLPYPGRRVQVVMSQLQCPFLPAVGVPGVPGRVWRTRHLPGWVWPSPASDWLVLRPQTERSCLSSGGAGSSHCPARPTAQLLQGCAGSSLAPVPNPCRPRAVFQLLFPNSPVPVTVPRL